MKINEIKINSYGNLKNKEINFKNGVNIVYGDNEKGKSTLLNCIVNMLYGTSKIKKGKDISDYDKYKPWNSEEFSGKMSYELDNGKKYEIFREFGKKSPQVYDENMEDISKSFSIDKSTGNEFFYEQTGVDEQTFISTVVSFQNEVELDNQTQNILLQKMANTSSTGSEEISYKKAIEKLNKKQLEEVGTNRSQGKTINVVMARINELQNQEHSLKQYENYKYEVEEKIGDLEKNFDEVKYKSEFLSKLKNINQNFGNEMQKLKYSEGKIDEIEGKIQALINEKENLKTNYKGIEQEKTKKCNIMPNIALVVILIAIAIIMFITLKENKIIAFIPILLAAVMLGITSSKYKKSKKKSRAMQKEYERVNDFNNSIQRRAYEIDAQIEILEKNKDEYVSEAERIRNENIKNINNLKENLKSEYSNKINISSMLYYFNTTDLTDEIEKNQRILNDSNLELHRLNLDKDNIVPKLNELVENEETMEYLKEELQALNKKNDAINMVKEIIEISYQKMRSEVTPKFTDNLSRNMSYITENKYNKVVFSESEGILVEMPNGEYKNANLLSKGTIQQLYIAFRLSLVDEICQEKMPVIFDEIFAFCDDTRMQEMLKIISTYSNEHQIILFTCTNREENILKNINIEFNKVVL